MRKSPVSPAWTPYTSPSWSPLDPTLAFTGEYATVFPGVFFRSLAGRPPTPTQIRLLCDAIAKKQRIGLRLTWLPAERITPGNFVHVFAAALSNGPSALLNFVDLFDEKLRGYLRDVMHDLVFEDNHPAVSVVTRQIFVSAMAAFDITYATMLGQFFAFLDLDRSDDQSRAYTLLTWFLRDDEAVLNAMALRTLRVDLRKEQHDAARNFLDPASPYRLEAFLDEHGRIQMAYRRRDAAPAAPQTTSVPIAPKADPSDIVDRQPSPADDPVSRKSVWTPPTPPEGVEIADRALRELRKERSFPEERFADALALLGAYRRMRLGEISDEDYQIACRERRFTDSRCFADAGSLKAFKADYTVRHAGQHHLLMRHLKWGKSNNAIASMRVYYAWDEDRKVVVLGSAPRHLPIWIS